MSQIALHVGEISKYFSAVHMRAYCYSEDVGRLTGVKVFLGGQLLPSTFVYLQKYDNNAQEFTIQFLSGSTEFPGGVEIVLFCGEHSEKFVLDDLQVDLSAEQKDGITEKFLEMIAALPVKGPKRLLDVGGRARSRKQRTEDYPGFDCTVVDIVEQDGVDVVCDAHEMSAHLRHGYYDVIICVSVLEHILMPWKLALEMNRVLKRGGLALIHTHQTIGMHDIPWDFWRFSDQCWHGLFNKFTGFEVVDTGMTGFNRIIQSVYDKRYKFAEQSGGFEGSSVIIRKVSNTKLRWDVSLGDIVNTHYPTHPDGSALS